MHFSMSHVMQAVLHQSFSIVSILFIYSIKKESLNMQIPMSITVQCHASLSYKTVKVDMSSVSMRWEYPSNFKLSF